MGANNGGKVSNLTVGPTPSMGCPPFIQDQRRTVGVPTTNYTRPVLYRVGCRCGGYLTSLRGTAKYYTEEHMASNEEHSTFPYYKQSNSKREHDMTKATKPWPTEKEINDFCDGILKEMELDDRREARHKRRGTIPKFRKRLFLARIKQNN